MPLTYDQVSEEQKSLLSTAWAKIVEGLETYEFVTGADHLDDAMYESLWEMIEAQG